MRLARGALIYSSGVILSEAKDLQFVLIVRENSRSLHCATLRVEMTKQTESDLS